MMEQEKSDPNYIENKVKIAADSSKVLSAYLDEVNMEFVKHGVQDAYSIISELENTIIENLKALGKDTKLGTNEVLGEINKIGKPKRLVENYIDIHGEELEFQPVIFGQSRVKHTKEKYYIPALSENLVKREGTIEEGVKQFFGWVMMVIPTIILMAAINSLIDLDIQSSVEFVIGFVLTNALIEIWSGVRGTLNAPIWVMKLLRNINKNIIWTLAFTVLALNLFSVNLSQEYSITAVGEEASQFFFLVMAAEITYFVRDHLEGLYPLEPIFQSPIRILLLPNIFILFALGLFFTNITFFGPMYVWFMVNFWVSWGLMTIGLVIGLEKNFTPSHRLLIFTLLPTIFLLYVFGPTDAKQILPRAFQYDRSAAVQGLIWIGPFLLYLFEKYGKKLVEKTREIQN